ncbi:acylphosphatase [Candidatus Woesearchaeota archaeon]|nr:acylphosphatase [Candidatus Woesearchaeota archaeon]
MKRIKILINGMVTGVFFRKFICDHATSLGLSGYVRNTEDGGVEAVFEGDEDKINKMIEICKKGPSTAKVENIKIIEEKVKYEKGFVRKN